MLYGLLVGAGVSVLKLMPPALVTRWQAVLAGGDDLSMRACVAWAGLFGRVGCEDQA